jgi:acyl-CoA thioester hydrolase
MCDLSPPAHAAIRTKVRSERGKRRRAPRYALPVSPYVHRRTFRVVMSEVDVAQIHFTNAYRWMDRGLSEWLAEIGHPFTSILETGPGIPIVDSNCAFLGRIMLDDVIEQTTVIGVVGRTSFRSLHEFVREGEAVARGALVHVCVDRGTREPVPVPEWLRERALGDDASHASDTES